MTVEAIIRNKIQKKIILDIFTSYPLLIIISERYGQQSLIKIFEEVIENSITKYAEEVKKIIN